MKSTVNYKKYIKVILFGLVGGVIAFDNIHSLSVGNLYILSSLIVIVSTTLFVLIESMYTNLISLPLTSFMKNLMLAGFYQRVVWEVSATLYWCIQTSILAIVCLFLDGTDLYYGVVTVIWSFTTSIGILTAAVYHLRLISEYKDR